MKERDVAVTAKFKKNDGPIQNNISVVPVFSSESYPARKTSWVRVTLNYPGK